MDGVASGGESDRMTQIVACEFWLGRALLVRLGGRPHPHPPLSRGQALTLSLRERGFFGAKEDIFERPVPLSPPVAGRGLANPL